MSEQRINVELLEQVKAHILAEPRRYHQAVIGTESERSPCGTAACLFGWAGFLSGEVTLQELARIGRYDGEDFMDRVQQHLGFNDAEADIVACRYGERWPEPFKTRFSVAESDGDKAGQARAAADYIDHIIRTGRVK